MYNGVAGIRQFPLYPLLLESGVTGVNPKISLFGLSTLSFSTAPTPLLRLLLVVLNYVRVYPKSSVPASPRK